MKCCPLIWTNVWRRRVRTTFTLLSLFIAFLLFGLIMTIRAAFSLGVDIAGLDRLVLINKVTLLLPLPISYQRQIQQTPGVKIASHQTWFNGAYQKTTNVLTTIAVDPEPFLQIYPEFVLPAAQLKAWQADRQGVIVGKELAARYGWKIGDRIPLMAPMWQPKEPWEFNIAGIYDAGPSVDKTQLFLRYDYLDENRAVIKDSVGWY